MKNQGVDMPWAEFKRRGVYKFEYGAPIVAFQAFIEGGIPFPTPSGKIEIFSSKLVRIDDWKKTKHGHPIQLIPKWIAPASQLVFKCNLCVDEIDTGRKPCCVIACMMRVLDVGLIDALRAGSLPTKARTLDNWVVNAMPHFADPARARPPFIFVLQPAVDREP